MQINQNHLSFSIETSVMPSEQDANAEVAVGLNSIPLARWRLKCDLCKAANDKSKSKRGAPIQCIKGKCVRAYHVSCALK